MLAWCSQRWTGNSCALILTCSSRRIILAVTCLGSPRNNFVQACVGGLCCLFLPIFGALALVSLRDCSRKIRGLKSWAVVHHFGPTAAHILVAATLAWNLSSEQS